MRFSTVWSYHTILMYNLLLTQGCTGFPIWPRKGVWGCATLETPFSRLCSSQGSHLSSPLFTRVPFHAIVSSQDPPFWEKWEIVAFLTPFFCQNFALKPPNLEISVHKPPNLEIFTEQDHFFGENDQFTSPTSEIRAAHPYLKKSWVPPG